MVYLSGIRCRLCAGWKARKKNKKREDITGVTRAVMLALAIKPPLFPYKPCARRVPGADRWIEITPRVSARTCYEDDSGRHACRIWGPIKCRCTGVRPPCDTCSRVISVSAWIWFTGCRCSWKRSSTVRTADDKCSALSAPLAGHARLGADAKRVKRG